MTNEIDWTKAPEGATHYTKETNVTSACWVKLKDDSCGYITMSHHKNNEAENIWQIGEFHTSELTVIPKPLQPVFSRTIEEANKLIKKLGDAANNITTIHLYEDAYDVASEMLDLVTEYETPPIELIDREFYGFEYNSASYRGIYSKRDDRFIFADGHVMASYCKSIKLLEVK